MRNNAFQRLLRYGRGTHHPHGAPSSSCTAAAAAVVVVVVVVVVGMVVVLVYHVCEIITSIRFESTREARAKDMSQKK